MARADGFDLFIADLFNLYNGLARELATDRQHVAAASSRALAVLRTHRPDDEGEEILIETAIEQFEDLRRKAGGTRS